MKKITLISAVMLFMAGTSMAQGVKGNLSLSLGATGAGINPNAQVFYNDYRPYAGWGFGVAWNGNAVSVADQTSHFFGGIGGGIDYGITEDITLGGAIGMLFGGSTISTTQYYTVYNPGGSYVMYANNVDYKMSYMNFYIGPRAAFHFQRVLSMPSKMDWYAGMGLGVSVTHGKIKSVEESNPNNGYELGSEISRIGKPSKGDKFTGADFYVNVFTGFNYSFSDKLGIYAEFGAGYNSLYGQVGLSIGLN